VTLDVFKAEMVALLSDARRAVGRVLDAAHATRNSRRFVDAVAAAAPNAQVAVGVGRTPLHGWISTDISRNVGIYLDLTQPWPTGPNAVAHVYGDNVIEHFPIDKARQVLANCLEALAPGGRIRLSTPDLERAARAYLDRSEVGDEHMRHYEPSEIVTEHPVDHVRMLFAYNDHWAGYLYDEASLTEELARAGFESIVRCDPGESEDAAFRGLESRATGSFRHFQLVLEASKPLE